MHKPFLFHLFFLLFFCLSGKTSVVAQTGNRENTIISSDSDTTLTTPLPSGEDTLESAGEKEFYIRQLRIGFDISRIAFNLMYPSRIGYEIQADYRLPKHVYLVGEGGLGKGRVNYDFLKYNTSGYFLRVGIEKSMLGSLGDHDFDIGFFGVRYGIGSGRRNEAYYAITSPFGGLFEDSVAGQNYVAHWGELTAGIKVELWKGLFAGWNVRGKFLFNAGIFRDMAPNYIPGYGKGEKSSIFDFNFYLSYAIRWGDAAAASP